MSTHLTKYSNSKDANEYLQIKNPKYRDWEVITLFYSALHLVERYCEVHGLIIPKSHIEREDIVSLYLSDIEEDYLNLYILSKNARYESLINNTDLSSAYAYYSTIESFITQEI